MKDEDLEVVLDDDENVTMSISKRKSNDNDRIVSKIIEEKVCFT
jgi:hypothetical protein